MSFGNANNNEIAYKNGVHKHDLSKSSFSVSDDYTIEVYRAASDKYAPVLFEDVSKGFNWGLKGNALTTADWLGSTNNNPINFRIGNIERFKMDVDNRLTIGTGATNEYTASFTLKSYDGVSASESAEILNSGSIGMRFNIASNREWNGYIGSTKSWLWNSQGINLLTAGQTVTGLKTPVSNSDATNKEYVDNKAGADYITSFPTIGGAITVSLSDKIQQVHRYDFTGRTVSVTLSVSNLKAGGIYIFAWFNKGTSYNLTFDASQFKASDGGALTQPNTTNIAGVYKFYSDGTLLYNY
jgi:hypothetical protein